MAQYETANDLINEAAVEVGLDVVTDVFSVADPIYRQFVYLLNSYGKELSKKSLWRDLVATHEFTMVAGQSDYPIPDDFSYMIPQTQWDKTSAVPIIGPLSPQEWNYLQGRGLVTSTIYISFRMKNGMFSIFPSDPSAIPGGKELFYEYVRNTWVESQAPAEPKENVTVSSDVVLFPPILIKFLLKAKFLEAKGMDSTKARDEYNEMFDATSGQDKSAPILNAGRYGGSFPYIDWFNAPDTGYGP